MPIRISYQDVLDNAADKSGPYTPELSAVQLVLVVYMFSVLADNLWMMTDQTDDTADVVAGVIGAMLDET